MRWEVCVVWADQPDEVSRVLSEGWEPFSVIYMSGPRLWLRREVTDTGIPAWMKAPVGE